MDIEIEDRIQIDQLKTGFRSVIKNVGVTEDWLSSMMDIIDETDDYAVITAASALIEDGD